jgi:hypothetical protein
MLVLYHKQKKLMRNLLLTTTNMAVMTSHATEEYRKNVKVFSSAKIHFFDIVHVWFYLTVFNVTYQTHE